MFQLDLAFVKKMQNVNKITIRRLGLQIFEGKNAVAVLDSAAVAEKAKGECDWMVMTSVFVTSQSHPFFLFARTNSPSGKQA